MVSQVETQQAPHVLQSNKLVGVLMPSSTGPKVYFVENLETGRIKIGFTTGSVSKRLASLRTATDCELRLLGVTASDARYGTTERQIHLRLSKSRYRGEWFERDVLPVVQEILELRDCLEE